VPTKEIKRQARGLVEALESRVHAGPPVCPTEIHSAREFLRQNDFSTASDYFSRLGRIQDQLVARQTAVPRQKRDYGGEAAGGWMQVQSVYDHIILSTCHGGEFNSQRGRVKVSHRFNDAGRIDFVELKFLRSLQPCLNGATRKLVMVQDYQNRRKDWFAAEAHVLRVLPRELIFLFGDIFRCPRAQVLEGLINIGHRIADDLLGDLRVRPVNGHAVDSDGHSHQLCLGALVTDEVALPILEQAAGLESCVEMDDAERVVVRYVRK
jgi:hypothetical protein